MTESFSINVIVHSQMSCSFKEGYSALQYVKEFSEYVTALVELKKISKETCSSEKLIGYQVDIKEYT